MRAQRRGRGFCSSVGYAKLTLILFLSMPLLLGPVVIAQDTGKIRITLTVPQQIRAEVYASTPLAQEVCIDSADSVAFSVAALIRDVESWRLQPLRPAVPVSTGACASGVRLSIEAGNGNPVTLVFSPE